MSTKLESGESLNIMDLRHIKLHFRISRQVFGNITDLKRVLERFAYSRHNIWTPNQFPTNTDIEIE
jgi:hypothetical protein